MRGVTGEAGFTPAVWVVTSQRPPNTTLRKGAGGETCFPRKSSQTPLCGRGPGGKPVSPPSLPKHHFAEGGRGGNLFPPQVFPNTTLRKGAGGETCFPRKSHRSNRGPRAPLEAGSGPRRRHACASPALGVHRGAAHRVVGGSRTWQA